MQSGVAKPGRSAPSDLWLTYRTVEQVAPIDSRKLAAASIYMRPFECREEPGKHFNTARH